MTITIPDTLPPICACLDPTGLAPDRRDFQIGEAWAKHDVAWYETATPYAFQWGNDYAPTLWFPTPPATITQEPA